MDQSSLSPIFTSYRTIERDSASSAVWGILAFPSATVNEWSIIKFLNDLLQTAVPGFLKTYFTLSTFHQNFTSYRGRLHPRSRSHVAAISARADSPDAPSAISTTSVRTKAMPV
jgi:hypothetical protein